MVKSETLYWCDKCGVPVLQKTCENCGGEGRKICSDLKPMFAQECEFLERQTGRKLPGGSWRDGLWMRYKTIWFNGERLMRLSADGKPRIIKEYHNERGSQHPRYRITPEVLWMANKSTLDSLENEAIYFIRQVTGAYLERKPVVSFSGGKDSTVVSYLVRKALRTHNILHIFGDTTIEYPDTYSYVQRFRNINGQTPFLVAKTVSDFMDMCSKLEPPTVYKRWCCNVFKTSPVSAVMESVSLGKGVISFEGIRRGESKSRRDYQRLYNSKKIPCQLSAEPIIEWRSSFVWLYILANCLDFNEAYKKGFPRVGCMFCPNNSPYTDYLVESAYPNKMKGWLEFLRDFARRAGKEDPEDYVKSGAWKLQIGIGNNVRGEIKIETRQTKPCTGSEYAVNYTLGNNFSKELIERFKPLGELIEVENKPALDFIVRDVETDEPLFRFQGREDMPRVKISYFTKSSWLIRKVESQLKKFQACILCGACVGICPLQAIKINSNFRIDENLCAHCGRCLSSKYMRSGCIASDLRRRGVKNGSRL